MINRLLILIFLITVVFGYGLMGLLIPLWILIYIFTGVNMIKVFVELAMDIWHKLIQ